MFRQKSTDEGSNFWISYADLMAGLLFVFILLIGAIVSKSIILKSDLHKKEDRLAQLSANLKSKEEALQKNKDLLSEKEQDLLDKKQKLGENMKTLKLKEEEITKLTRMLAQANAQKADLRKQIVIVQQMLDETNATLQKNMKDFEGKVLVLTNQVQDLNKTVKDKDIKLLKLLNALDEKETKYDALIEKLQKQKAKIKSLTGIKLKVIAALKERLGSKIDIDKKTGSLKLASNILFDKGSAQLKEPAKAQLKKAFEEYIGTLVSDPRIKPHLEKIIIEGHTDSDGGYLYNLDLSQKRALAVMNYLLTLPIAQKYDLKPLMSASGRAYMDRVIKNGVEDKEASRRIEIKFRLKNEDAMHEIEKVLDAE
ncbi:MAG: OmpA family protein [Sulfurovum sp.]|nr:OmpA family protein [Sulfurovum sp.]